MLNHVKKALYITPMNRDLVRSKPWRETEIMWEKEKRQNFKTPVPGHRLSVVTHGSLLGAVLTGCPR